MKKSLTFFSLALVVVSLFLSHGSWYRTDAAAVTDQLLARWEFSNNLNDESGNDHVLTPSDSESYFSDRFNNGNSDLNIPNGSYYASDVPFTDAQSAGSLSLWAYSFGHAPWGVPIGWKTENGYVLIDQGESGNVWRAAFMPNGDSTEASVSAPASGYLDHIVMTWQQSGVIYTINFYVNGKYIGSSPFEVSSGSPVFTIGNAAIGAGGDMASNYFVGEVDDVRVYSKALSPDEVTSLFTNGSDSDPVLSYGEGVPTDNAEISASSVQIDLFSSGEGANSETMDWDGSLAGWWRFSYNGDMNDYTGNNGYGMFSGAGWTADGKFGGAATFDGESYIQVSTGEALDITGDITMSAWVKTSAETGERMIFARYSGTSPHSGYGLMLNDGSPSFWSNGNGIWEQAASSVSDGAWHLVTVTGSGSSGIFYVDGAQVDTFTYAPPSSNFNNGYIGINPDMSNSPFDGDIDDLQIYSRALSAQEVSSLYDASGTRYDHTFADLSPGSYTYRGYQQYPNGAVVSTELRTLTIADTVTISSCDDFIAINEGLAGNYILANDLDCSSDLAGIMVGSSETPFTGTFDGQGHEMTISVTVDNQADVGLFRVAHGASIQNLTVRGYVQSIALNDGDYFNGSNVGAVIGTMQGGTLQNVGSRALVRGGQFVGGLIGRLGYDTDYGPEQPELYLPHVTENMATGDVYGNYGVGGMIGYTLTNATIDKLYARGNVFGQSNVGGLVGELHDTQVTNSYARGNISNVYPPLVPVGTFHVSQKVGGTFVEKYKDEFPKQYATKQYHFMPIDHRVELEITQKHIPYGDIDQIALTACGSGISPEYARYVQGGESVTDDIASIDKNVIVSHERPVHVAWNIPTSCTSAVTVSLTANEYGEGSPLMYKDRYSAGQPQSYSPNWLVTSGHPQGSTYVNMSDDDQNLYVSVEVTPDNTNEIHQDWTDITIGGKSFRIDDEHPQYGSCTFGYTDKVSYKHNTCNYVIPKSEIASSDFDFTLRYYGTASATGFGGLIGLMDGGAILHNTYATGNVRGEDFVGGLVGYDQAGDISASFASNAYVEGSDYVGGFVGILNAGDVEGMWYTGSSDLQEAGYSSGHMSVSMASEPSDFYSTTFDAGWNFETTWSSLDHYFPTLQSSTMGGVVSENPYLVSVSDCTNLQDIIIGDTSGDYYYYLTTDLPQELDCTGGTAAFLDGTFKGVIDGNGHSVFISLSNSHVGISFIDELSGGTVKNLSLSGSTLSTGGSGSLAAGAYNFAVIDNVFSTVDVNAIGGNNIGGLVGDANSVLFSNDYYLGDINALTTTRVGGFVGNALNTVIYGGIVRSSIIDGLNEVGGFVGNASNVEIRYSTVDPGEPGTAITGTHPVVGEGVLGVGGVVGGGWKTTLHSVRVKSGTTIKGYWDSEDECNTTSCSAVGGLMGSADFGPGGSIDGSTVEEGVTIQGYAYMGGLIGYSMGGFNIQSCVSDATFDLSSIAQHEPSYIGGLVGLMTAMNDPIVAVLTDSSSSTDIDTTENLGMSVGNFGGIAGSVVSDGTIGMYLERNHYTGNIVGGIQTGGLYGTFGAGGGGMIQDSYSTGTVSGAAASHGGAIGFLNNGGGTLTLNKIFALGDVEGTGYVGGLIGEVGNPFDASYNTRMNYVYAAGDVDGTDDVGGLIGMLHTNYDDEDNTSMIYNAYASGAVHGTGDTIGGLIGDFMGTGVLLNSFYGGSSVTGASPMTYGALIGYTGFDDLLTNLYVGQSVQGPVGCIVKSPGFSSKEDACISVAESSLQGAAHDYMVNTVGFDADVWAYRDGHYPDLAFTSADDPFGIVLLSDVSATPSTTSAVITWNSDEVGSSRVDYGLDDTYGTSTDESDTAPRVTSHSVTLTGLRVCTTYHYQVYSMDYIEGESVSEDSTFKTTGCTTGGGGGGGGGSILIPTPVVTPVSGSGAVRSPFKDILHSFAREQIEKLFKLGVIQGVTMTKFKPNDSVKRDQIVKVALLAFKYPIATDVSRLKDVCHDADLDLKSWYAPYMMTAVDAGIIQGYGDGSCRPEALVRRAEALKIIFLAGKKQLDAKAATLPFKDVPSDAWFKKYIDFAFAQGIVSGRSTTQFKPEDFMTRAEMAKVAVKTMEQ